MKLRGLIDHFMFGFNSTYTLDPPAEVPLTDVPGKLLNARLKYHNSGRVEMVETKFNMTEYNRIKLIVDKWFRESPDSLT